MPQHDASGPPCTWGARRRQSQRPRRRGRASLPHAAALSPARPRMRRTHFARGSGSAAVATDWPAKRLAAALALYRRVFVSAGASELCQRLVACHTGADDDETSKRVLHTAGQQEEKRRSASCSEENSVQLVSAR